MKRSNLLFLILGFSIIFFGCEKMDPLVPDLSSDQATTSLKAAKKPFIEFKGESTPMMLLYDAGTSTVLPNGKVKVTGMVADFYDAATDLFDPPKIDLLVTGQSIWYENWLIEADGSSAIVWGKADLNLDIGGTWAVTWHGTITANEGYTVDDLGQLKAVAYAVGTGKTGDVKGMVAHWTYKMDSKEFGFLWKFTGSYH